MIMLKALFTVLFLLIPSCGMFSSGDCVGENNICGETNNACYFKLETEKYSDSGVEVYACEGVDVIEYTGPEHGWIGCEEYIDLEPGDYIATASCGYTDNFKIDS